MKFWELGPSIRAYRKELGFTQAELARRAGSSRVTLSKLENGRLAGISITLIISILDNLGLEIALVEPTDLPAQEELAERTKI